MKLRNPFKLEKLRIDSFRNRRRLGLPDRQIKVMFNPASFTMRHENRFHRHQGINTSGARATFSHARADELSLELVFDGTGVSDTGVLAFTPLATPTVTKQIDGFLTACFYLDGQIHEPKYLTIHWGDGPLANFECRLKDVEINYTAFDKSGAPLRATVKATFVQGLDPEKRSRRDRKSSPDLSHRRVVRAGDTLPLLCREIYGSAAPYLIVAAANGLDDFRRLEPGRELVFPPLTAPPAPPPAAD